MKTTAEQNKSHVLEAFDTLFNKRDYAAAEKFWSPHYIQHSAHIEPGREGLFNLVKTLPPTLRYEPGRIVADGDFVPFAVGYVEFDGYLRVEGRLSESDPERLRIGMPMRVVAVDHAGIPSYAFAPGESAS